MSPSRDARRVRSGAPLTPFVPVRRGEPRCLRVIPALVFCLAIQAQENVGKRQTGPLLFAISSDKTDYDAGETITITSELRNVSDHDVAIRRDTLHYFSMDVMLPGPDWLPFRDRAVLSEEGSRKEVSRGQFFHQLVAHEAR
jgi:hypothetical protein